jgi:hypothetical protein
MTKCFLNTTWFSDLGSQTKPASLILNKPKFKGINWKKKLRDQNEKKPKDKK